MHPITLFIDIESQCLFEEFGGPENRMIILMIMHDGETDEMVGTALRKRLRGAFLP
jgi:hypothetical protein